MRTIRNNVFETNSSSCHAVAFPKTWNEIEDFKNNKLVLIFDDWGNIDPKVFEDYPDYDLESIDDREAFDYGGEGSKAILVPIEKAYQICLDILNNYKAEDEKLFNNRLKDFFASDEEPKLENFTSERFMEFRRHNCLMTVQTWDDFIISGDWNCPISIKFLENGQPYINCCFHD